MKQLQMIKVGGFRTSLNSWKGMPKQAKTPEGYTLQVNGKELKSPEVMLTGGGAFPAYTYIQHDGQARWFAGHFDTGTAVEIIDPTTPATPAASPAQVEAAQATPVQPEPKPAKPAKQSKK